MSEANEPQLVLEYFADGPGFFVEVGANHPQHGSQTWHLEQHGWDGILIEPLPGLAEQLRQARKAKVFEVACSSPDNSNRRVPFYACGGGSSLDRKRMQPGFRIQAIREVTTTTLNDILLEAQAPRPLDFLSIDVEGHEIEVLRGFDFNLWHTRLILLADHVGDLNKHRFIKSREYKLVRRTGVNGWYIPASTSVDFGWKERLRLLCKYRLALPIRILRNFPRRLRQPFKDRRRDHQFM